MKRSVISASTLVVSLGYFVTACGSSDTTAPAQGADGGAFNYGGGAGVGQGGSFGGANVGGSFGGANVGGANVGGANVGGSFGGANIGGANVGGANVGGANGGQGNGGANVGGDGSGGAAGYKPACITDPANQAIIVGDSYVTGFGSPPLQPVLAGIIPSIGQYVNYAGAGCSMASGGICTGVYGNVPAQSTTALQQHPQTKFVIMDGGGNDILICSAATYPNCGTVCKQPGSSQQKVCTDIVDLAITTAGKVMTDAAAAGVQDVVYFFYPHLPGVNAGYSEILDYAEPKAKALCDSAATTTGGKLHCYFVDMVQPFKNAGGDGNAANFVGDSIHPSAAGDAIIAKTVTDVMTAQCLGQASGCCK